MTGFHITARLLLAVALTIGVRSACAHEVRPAYLEIEQAEHSYRVLWKQPAIGDRGVRLIPHLSGGALERPPDAAQLQEDSLLRVWNVRDDAIPLDQQSLTITGLERTITDVFVKITLADGRTQQRLLKPDQPSLDLGNVRSARSVPAYLTLGIEHILTGFDHLLFVLGFVLLVPRIGTLIKTISAFTLAHSATLAGTALGVIHPRPAVIETLVALSIVLLAVEIVKRHRGEPGLTARFPWLIAAAFGLLHGAAFAGALLDIGLPREDVVPALFLFNIGVEFGQLLFIAAVLLIMALLRRLRPAPASRYALVPAYAIGSLASAWTIERLLTAFV